MLSLSLFRQLLGHHTSLPRGERYTAGVGLRNLAQELVGVEVWPQLDVAWRVLQQTYEHTMYMYITCTLLNVQTEAVVDSPGRNIIFRDPTLQIYVNLDL